MNKLTPVAKAREGGPPCMQQKSQASWWQWWDCKRKWEVWGGTFSISHL